MRNDEFEQRLEARRRYRGDVAYEVWRSGGNPDAVDYDRVDDYYWDGYDVDDVATIEMRIPKEG